MELYAERGFDQTTVAEIARRAGLTERTFFRHYADKREVLFGGAPFMEEQFVGAVAAAPAPAGPMDAVAAGLYAVGTMLQEGREAASLRQSVISSHPELQERELVKLASLSAALTRTLCERGVPESDASLAAEAGIAVFKVAFGRWIADLDGPELPQVMRESLDELRTVVAGDGSAAS